MIEIELSTAFFLFTTLPLLVVFGIWIFLGFKRPSHKTDPVDKELIWSCSICMHVYVDSKNPEISPCPQCGSLNKRGDIEKLKVSKSQERRGREDPEKKRQGA